MVHTGTLTLLFILVIQVTQVSTGRLVSHDIDFLWNKHRVALLKVMNLNLVICRDRYELFKLYLNLLLVFLCPPLLERFSNFDNRWQLPTNSWVAVFFVVYLLDSIGSCLNSAWKSRQNSDDRVILNGISDLISLISCRLELIELSA